MEIIVTKGGKEPTEKEFVRADFPKGQSIILHTRQCRNIPNVQDWDIPMMRLAAIEEEVQKTLQGKEHLATKRVPPNGVYNCHGMTFANRRTSVPDVDNTDIKYLLEDDGYEEIEELKSLPGDIILYHVKDEITHSGIYLYFDLEYEIKMILSKWGSAGEYIHGIYVCPYTDKDLQITYHRVNYQEPPNVKTLLP